MLKEYHQFLKDNPDKRLHSMALSYASKKVKDTAKKVEQAHKLWGEQNLLKLLPKVISHNKQGKPLL